MRFFMIIRNPNVKRFTKIPFAGGTMKLNLLRLTPFVSALFIAVFTPAALGLTGIPDIAGNQDVSVTLVEANNFSAQLEFKIENLEHEQLFIGNDSFDKYVLDGETDAGPTGWPQLPSVTRFMLIPPQSGVSLNISNLKTRIERDVKPLPRQAPSRQDEVELSVGTSPDFDPNDLYIDPANLEHDGFWPPETARLGRPAIMRGYRIIPIIINPLRWNARTGEMEILESIDIQLDFTTDENRINLVEDPERPRPSVSVDRIISQLVMNPPPPRRDDPQVGGSILYITPDRDDVEEALAPLIEWRRRMGWTVELMRAENQAANSIRNDIIEAYEGWDVPPEHVVLVADAIHWPNPTGNNYVLGCFDHRGNAGFPYESDHDFTCLEGDDLLPELAVGRYSYDSRPRLEGIIDKILQYESDPYIGEGDDENWQKRAAVTSINSLSGWSSIDMCRWAKQLFLRHGYDEVAEAYFPNADEGNFIPTEINNGISFFLFRGHLHMGLVFRFDDIDRLRNGRMLNFSMIVTCNTGDYGEHVSSPDGYHSERFLRNPRGGSIGSIGASGASHTTYNNLITCGTVRGPVAAGIYTQGWALMLGKLDLYRCYSGHDDSNNEHTGLENWMQHIWLYNLMGDPATDLYTDVPKLLAVEHPEEIRLGESRFEVDVAYDLEEDVPAENVLVCLYKPEGFQLVEWTDENGHVVFNLDPAWTEEGFIQLTVTGHNLKPYLEEFEVEPTHVFIGAGTLPEELDDDEEGESSGDGDGIANPTEIIELALDIVNYGEEQPEGEMIVALTPALPSLAVAEDADTVRFEAAPDSGESVTGDFVIEIGGGFPHGNNAVFNLTASVGEETWKSAVIIPVVGPQIELASFQWDDEPLRTASTADFSVVLRNSGEKNAPPLAVTLISLTESAEAGNMIRHIDDGIQVGAEENPDDYFSVGAKVYHLGGNRIDLAMLVEAENGFQDTVFFSVPTEPPESNQPFGPDGYGYLCVDDTDTSWFDFPVFEWVEIDPNQEGPGTDTELNDRSAEHDESVVMDLPFVFNYYGEEFDRVTICTNGWLALGNYLDLATAVNRRIPGGLVAPAIIAPFWDDLLTRDDSGIYTWFDEENHRFIVEWSKMRRLEQNGQAGGLETFQVILHDPQHHPSFTEDADIIFQYLNVENRSSCNQLWDTPYATVGIGNPDMNDGLEYTYYDNYTAGAAPLDSARAIRFTTMVSFDVGCAEGWVTDVRTGQPMEGVDIFTSYGYTAVTDTNGYYFIDEMLADMNHLYEFTASKWGWNDSTLTDILIVMEDTIQVDFGLLHPEFNVHVREEGLWFGMHPDSEHDFTFELSNDGNGTLGYTSRFNYILDEEGADENGGGSTPRDNPDELWEPLLMWSATDSTGDQKLAAVCWVEDRWFVSGSNNSENTNYFYIFDRYGSLIDTLVQPVEGTNGIQEMAYYDGRLYCVVSTFHELLVVDPENGEEIARYAWPDRVQSIRNITVEPDSGHFFVSSITMDVSELALVNDTLITIASFRPTDPRDNENIRKYGMAWFRDDPDGYNLYIAEEDINQDPFAPDISIYKVNPRTGEVEYLTNLAFLDPLSRGRGGICVTSKWNNMVWVFAELLDHPDGDQVFVFELGPNASWIDYSPRSDTLFAGESNGIQLHINTEDLVIGQYGVILEFTHNAIERVTSIPVALRVSWDDISTESGIPLEFDLDQNWPNPFNATTNIMYCIEKASHVKLTVYDIVGRQVIELIDENQPAGNHRITFDASKLPNGIYIYRLENSGRMATKKMVVLK